MASPSPGSPASRVRETLAAIALVGTAGCGPDQTVNGDNIVARVRACPWETGDFRKQGAFLEGQRWQDASLVVSVKETFTCGHFVLQSPSYRVSENELVLTWSWKLGPEQKMAACVCDRKITFTLDALPRRDYTVRLPNNAR